MARRPRRTVPSAAAPPKPTSKTAKAQRSLRERTQKTTIPAMDLRSQSEPTAKDFMEFFRVESREEYVKMRGKALDVIRAAGALDDPARKNSQAEVQRENTALGWSFIEQYYPELKSNLPGDKEFQDNLLRKFVVNLMKLKRRKEIGMSPESVSPSKPAATTKPSISSEQASAEPEFSCVTPSRKRAYDAIDIEVTVIRPDSPQSMSALFTVTDLLDWKLPGTPPTLNLVTFDMVTAYLELRMEFNHEMEQLIAMEPVFLRVDHLSLKRTLEALARTTDMTCWHVIPLKQKEVLLPTRSKRKTTVDNDLPQLSSPSKRQKKAENTPYTLKPKRLLSNYCLPIPLDSQTQRQPTPSPTIPSPRETAQCNSESTDSDVPIARRTRPMRVTIQKRMPAITSIQETFTSSPEPDMIFDSDGHQFRPPGSRNHSISPSRDTRNTAHREFSRLTTLLTSPTSPTAACVPSSRTPEYRMDISRTTSPASGKQKSTTVPEISPRLSEDPDQVHLTGQRFRDGPLQTSCTGSEASSDSSDNCPKKPTDVEQSKTDSAETRGAMGSRSTSAQTVPQQGYKGNLVGLISDASDDWVRISSAKTMEDEIQSLECNVTGVSKPTVMDLKGYYPKPAIWETAYENLEHWNDNKWPGIAGLFRHNENIRFHPDSDELTSINAPGMMRNPFIHQAAGVFWWLQQEAGPFGAGLVGDGMGLGKTTLCALAVATSAKLLEMELHRQRHPGKHRSALNHLCGLEEQKDCNDNALYPQCPCGRELIAQHRGREGLTFFLAPPGNVGGLAREIKEASSYLVVEIAATPPAVHTSIESLKGKSREEIARTVIVCAKSCFICYFSNKRQYRFLKDKPSSCAADIPSSSHEGANNSTLDITLAMARVIVDEAHTVRDSSSELLCLLAKFPCPVWFITGSATNLTPHDILGFIGVWEQSNRGKYLHDPATEGCRQEDLKQICRKLRKWSQFGGEEPQLDQCNQELECVVQDYSAVCRKTMIIRTTGTSIWGKRLIKLPLSEHFEVRCDFTDGDSRLACDKEFGAAVEDVRAVFNNIEFPVGDIEKDQYVGLLQKSRIGASIPLLQCDPYFMEMSLNAEDCNPTEIADNTCHFASRLDEIVASSNKLKWLRGFVSELGTDRDPDTGYEYPEKLVVFAAFPVVAYVIWLALRNVVPIPPVPEGYAAPQCAPHSPNREQVKLVYSTNATMRTREQIMSLFSHNLFEARIIVGTYGTIAESYNLTRAAKAVLFQPDWLTFGEMQAKARIWRCGQRRNVKIYRLLTADSVDIIMAERQAQGAQFNQAVLGIPSDFAETDEDVTEFSEPRVYHEMFPADDTDEI